jgi:hypothetical protein
MSVAASTRSSPRFQRLFAPEGRGQAGTASPCRLNRPIAQMAVGHMPNLPVSSDACRLAGLRAL